MQRSCFRASIFSFEDEILLVSGGVYVQSFTITCNRYSFLLTDFAS